MEAAKAPEQEAVQEAKKRRFPALKLAKKQKKWVRRGIILAAAAAGVFWFTHRAPAGGESGLAGQYTAQAVQRRDLTAAVSGTGTVAPIDSYQVRALTTGEVLEAPFEAGDRVEKGALLYRLDAGGAETAIQQARAGVEQARLNLEQARLNAEQTRHGIELAQLEVERAEKNVEQAKKGVERAQKSYDDYVRSLTIRAPEGGVVRKVLVQKGDILSPGSPVAEIADSSTLTLALPFHSADAQRLYAGQSAQVTISGTMETLPAVVESIAQADLPGTGGTLVRQVTLRLDNPGALTSANTATASVGSVACAGSGSFTEAIRRTVTAQTGGQVAELPVSVGSLVSEGSALAVLGGDTVQKSLEDLTLARENAQDAVSAAQDGVSSARNGVSNARDAAENAQITLKNAQLALENAQLSIQTARDALDNYVITAPISGTVIEKNIKAGDKVDGIESGALAVIYDMSCLKLEMNISELDLKRIQPGQEAAITADALPGQVFTGVLEKVSINGTTTNGFTTYPATILLEDYGGLNPGMNVSADIIVERIKDALSIPAAAVQRGDTVLVPLEGALSEDGTALIDPTRTEERAVTLGAGDGEFVEITSGLNEGEAILVPVQGMGG